MKGESQVSEVSTVPEGTQQSILLRFIAPSSTNPRKAFDKGALEELTDSVRRHGVLQPILVRHWPAGRKPPANEKPEYELVAGERRYRAAIAAELEAVPCVVRKLTDAEVLEIHVIENLQRSDLHPLEEAEGYRQLIAADKNKYDVARIAERIGRSVKYVYDRVKLLSLTKEAQALFGAGKITAGHAIVLARLTPPDQKRAIETHGALFDHERLLWDPNEDRSEARAMRKEDARKPVSVRELQAWIDKNVRFDVEGVEPMLFPETALTLDATRETAEKVVPITHDHYVTPDAKNDQRTYGPMSWRRADGKLKSKACDASITGVIVVGPGRGDAFKVCIDKKRCTTHWGAEQRASKKRADAAARGGNTGEDRYKREQEKREEEHKREEAQRARWKKALPEILKALAAAVKKLPTRAKGQLADVILREVSGFQGEFRGADSFLPLGTTAEDLVRHAAFIVLGREAGDYMAPREFPKRAKAFGVDVAKIVDAVAPKPPDEAKAKPAKKAGKTKWKKVA